MVDGVSLSEIDWSHLFAGLRTLRDALVKNAHSTISALFSVSR